MSYRYMVEIYAHANELLDMPGESDQQLVHNLLCDQYPSRFLPLSEKRMTRALRFLSKTPTKKRWEAWKKMDEATQVKIWTEARYPALRAASATAVAETVQPCFDGPYREAGQRIAKAVHDLRLQPTAWEIV